jgi:hypothetical protein
MSPGGIADFRADLGQDSLRSFRLIEVPPESGNFGIQTASNTAASGQFKHDFYFTIPSS